MQTTLRLLLFLFCVAAAEAFHTFELKNGSEIKGEIILERPDFYYVDLGFQLMPVPKTSVLRLMDVESKGDAVVNLSKEDSLYEVSNDRSDQPIREWVDQLGEAVALVQTPVGLGSGFVIHEDGYVVTNDHVIAGEHRISVTIFRKNEYDLSKVTYDNCLLYTSDAADD